MGWFRDVQCEPPDWPLKLMSGQTVTVDVPGDSWQVEFFDPVTGKSTGERRLAIRKRSVQIVLPEFHGSIAVRLKRLANTNHPESHEGRWMMGGGHSVLDG